MAIDVTAGAVLDHARGDQDVTALAADVLASCTTDSTPPPRRLYSIDETKGAA